MMEDFSGFPYDHDGYARLCALRYTGGLVSELVKDMLLRLSSDIPRVEVRQLLRFIGPDVMYQGLLPSSPLYVGDELAKRVSQIIVGNPDILRARGLDELFALAGLHARRTQPAFRIP
jgi:hypothetical protein